MQLTARTPRKLKLKRHNKSLQNQKNYLQRKLRQAHQAKLDLKLISEEDFIEICGKFLPTPSAAFIEAQIQILNTKRYPEKFKQLALAIYFCGPRAYSVLKGIFKLPSRRTLRRMTECEIGEGISEFSLAALKLKIKNFNTREKV